jgi:hypothetical protein
MDSHSRSEGSQGDDAKSDKLEHINTATGRSERDDQKFLIAIRRGGTIEGRDALSVGCMRQNDIVEYGIKAQICFGYSPVVNSAFRYFMCFNHLAGSLFNGRTVPGFA